MKKSETPNAEYGVLCRITRYPLSLLLKYGTSVFYLAKLSSVAGTRISKTHAVTEWRIDQRVAQNLSMPKVTALSPFSCLTMG